MLEASWFKRESGILLNVSEKEWNMAERVAKYMITKGHVKLPFKISRKDIINVFADANDYMNHSFLVLPDGTGGYKVGAMARAKSYDEGILGYGGFGEVKIVQWRNNETDAVKIEPNVRENVVEQQIMQELGYLRAEFVRVRATKTNWMHGREIKNKRYTVQKRHGGIDMRDYFVEHELDEMNVAEKYEMALQAAKSIQQLHAKGFLHCDIKPENFMVNVLGDTLVIAPIDFGFSIQLKTGETERKSDAGWGTVGYMAPEIGTIEKGYVVSPANGSIYSKASDVYALGVMFKHDLELAGEKDSPICRMVERMINPDPKKRPSVQEVVGVLESCKILNDYLEKYSAEIESAIGQKKKLWFAKNRIDPAAQKQMLEDFKRIFSECWESGNVSNTASQILGLMKENQKRHEAAKFSIASNFNLQILRHLPEELRKEICGKLGIAEDSNIFRKMSWGGWSARQKLAEKISRYSNQFSAHSVER